MFVLYRNIMILFVLVCVCVCVVNISCANSSDKDITMDDYLVAWEINVRDRGHADSNKIVLKGEHLIAWSIAYADFVSTDDQLGHYIIGFAEDDENFIVFFIPRMLTEEESRKTGVLSFGSETKYWINKTTYKIFKREFYQ